METKKQIRKKYRGIRDAIPAMAAKELSFCLSQQILQWNPYKEAEKIYFYYPLGREVSLLPVIEDAMMRRKQVAFPKVNGDNMEFYEITSLSQLAEGCFHVMEPNFVNGKQGLYPKLADWKQALCFVPGVAFDKTGVRFGYGKGYYDRYFSNHSGCRLVGCAYECQVAEKLPADAWDIRMDDLVTEKLFYSEMQGMGIYMTS